MKQGSLRLVFLCISLIGLCVHWCNAEENGMTEVALAEDPKGVSVIKSLAMQASVNVDQTRYYRNLGRAYRWAGHIEKAAIAYGKYGDLHPITVDGYMHSALLYLQIGKFREAHEKIIHGSTLDPRGPSKWALIDGIYRAVAEEDNEPLAAILHDNIQEGQYKTAMDYEFTIIGLHLLEDQVRLLEVAEKWKNIDDQGAEEFLKNDKMVKEGRYWPQLKSD